MARKLSSIARCVIWIGTAAASLAAASVSAQSGIQVSPATKQVVNPFAAKRQAESPAAAQPPIAVPPAEVDGPRTYQNPFSGRGTSPRFVTPRLQPGPMSRWHREGEPAIHHAEPRPVHAVLEDAEPTDDQGDLSGPLAIQEKRTALFTLPKYELKAIQQPAPPDPAEFGSHQLTQPTWLLPDVTHTATEGKEVAESFNEIRATAQPPSDPFDAKDIEEVVVSDDTPPSTDTEQTPVEPVSPVKVATTTATTPVTMPLAAPVALPPTDPVTLPPTAPPTAEECYAQAERAATEAASTGDLAAVVQTCQQGLACEPDPATTASLRSLAAWACNRSGEIESDRRREDKALKAFELAIQWDPKCWLALHNRAVSRAQQGDLARALDDFNRSLQLNPGLAVAYRNRGELLAATGRTEEAVADYTTALAQMPQDADLYAMRGEAYHRLGRYDDALADLTQSIEIAPYNANPYAQRGNVHAERGDYERAITDFRQAMAIDADSVEAHRSLAWLLATCPNQRYRNPRQSLAAAERAAQLAPGDPFVLDALAAAHANAGQFDRAARFQQEAIVNVPADFAAPFRERLGLYEQRRPFRNGADDVPGENVVDDQVRAASLESSPRSPRSVR